MGISKHLEFVRKGWPPFSTTGEVNIHAVLVTFPGMQSSPMSQDEFARLIENGLRTHDFISLKEFYEGMSHGRLRIGSVSSEYFHLDAQDVDHERAYDDKDYRKEYRERAYAMYAQELRESGRTFAPRTHFMFGFDQKGAAGEHEAYGLCFCQRTDNPTTLIHEFGHNLGLFHTTILGKDRGDKSDRMGAHKGYMEFNAPNLESLGWLDDAQVVDLHRPGEYSLRPTELRNRLGGDPVLARIAASNCYTVYLSMRAQTGPFDAVHLDPTYADAMSVHTRTLDKRGRPKKTLLLAVLRGGERYVVPPPYAASGPIEVEVMTVENDRLTYRLAGHGLH